MKRRSFLKLIPFIASSAKAATIITEEKQNEWKDFSALMPKYNTYFRIKNKETGDIRVGCVRQYPKSKAIFLLYMLKPNAHQSTSIDEYDWKDWAWRYTDELTDIGINPDK